MNLLRASTETLLIALLMTACSGGGTGEFGSSREFHIPVSIVDGGVAAQAVNSMALVSLGSIYLEQQYAPPMISSVATQASGVDVNGQNIYVTYSYRDTTGAKKAGGVQRLSPLNCDSILTSYVDYCLSFGTLLPFANSDIYATATNGTNLYAVGSTTDASADPSYGRLYKVSLNASGDPLAITATQTLPSYVGTSVALTTSNVLATYGTSTSVGMMGGLGSFNLTTLAPINTQAIYDARWVATDPTSASTAWVVTGATSVTVFGKTLKYSSDASGAQLANYSSGGNKIPESRSTTIVGNQLIISSAGDQGFSVMCKATGATLTTKAAPILANVPTANSVTNGMAAIPGYLFVANGEAGVYIYTMDKSSALNTNYCQGITLNLLGRLALAADPSGNTYINAELSANSIKAVNVYTILNVLSSRLLVIASGNKGVSLLNVGGLTVSLTAVDDF